MLTTEKPRLTAGQILARKEAITELRKFIAETLAGKRTAREIRACLEDMESREEPLQLASSKSWKIMMNELRDLTP